MRPLSVVPFHYKLLLLAATLPRAPSSCGTELFIGLGAGGVPTNSRETPSRQGRPLMRETREAPTGDFAASQHQQNHPGFRYLQVTASTKALTPKGKGKKGNKVAWSDSLAIEGPLQQAVIPYMKHQSSTGLWSRTGRSCRKDNDASFSGTN